MSAHVLLNVLNELGEKEISLSQRGLPLTIGSIFFPKGYYW